MNYSKLSIITTAIVCGLNCTPSLGMFGKSSSAVQTFETNEQDALLLKAVKDNDPNIALQALASGVSDKAKIKALDQAAQKNCTVIAFHIFNNKLPYDIDKSLHEAIEQHDITRVKFWLDVGAQSKKPYGQEQVTAMQYAKALKYQDIVTLMQRKTDSVEINKQQRSKTPVRPKAKKPQSDAAKAANPDLLREPSPYKPGSKAESTHSFDFRPISPYESYIELENLEGQDQNERKQN